MCSRHGHAIGTVEAFNPVMKVRIICAPPRGSPRNLGACPRAIANVPEVSQMKRQDKVKAWNRIGSQSTVRCDCSPRAALSNLPH